jgi:hypothetical protein
MTAPLLALTGLWQLTLVGWPAWVVIPLAAAAFWAIHRCADPELADKPRKVQVGMKLLRGSTAALLLLLLVEPTLRRERVREELPTVAVLLDTSASMAATDKAMNARDVLNEATALALVPAELRDVSWQTAAGEVDAVLADLPGWLAALSVDDASGQKAKSAVRRAARTAVRARQKSLVALMFRLVGQEPLAVRLRAAANLMDRTDSELGGNAPAPADLVPAWRTWQQDGRDLVNRCLDAQRAADEVLLANEKPDSPLLRGIAEWGKLNRLERIRRLAVKDFGPLFEGRAVPRFMAMERSLSPLDPATGEALQGRLSGQTDFEAPLTELLRASGEEYLGGVLLLSDGRQTTGGAPDSSLRALASRGAKLAAIVVGDPEPPRDAAIGGITGSGEIFRGEVVRLDVRYRIIGFGETPWQLVLNRQRQEIERRTVRGTGQWQTARFEFPAEHAGLFDFQARLEPLGGAPLVTGEAHGILYETWSGISGYEVANLTQNAKFQGPPERREVRQSFAAPTDWGENYGARLRGYLIPPVGGAYVFQICADDKAELWLSTTAAPTEKTLIAEVKTWTPPLAWRQDPSQTSQPVTLRAGQPYYVEVLHKESIGGDHVAVGWQMPDGTLEQPIPGTRLMVNPVLAGGDDAHSEASLDNNQANVVVTVNEDPLRALLVDAWPRWESRYLVTLLERDRRVALTRRYRSIRLPRGEYELLPVDRQELDRSDVLIFGDLRPEEISPEDQVRIADFVGKRGGFVIFLAGPRGLPDAYGLGGLADLLPIRVVSGGSAPSSMADDTAAGIGVRLTAEGEASPVMAVLNDPALNRKLWPALPHLSRIHRNVVLKKGAQALLVTDDAAASPVVVAMPFGAGRVFYVGTDESWRWRDRLGDRVHQTFWLQVLRWGLGMRLRGHDPRLQVAVDRSVMAPEEQADVRARATLADGAAATGNLVVAIELLDDAGNPVAGTEKRVVEMVPMGENPSLHQVAVAGLGEGRWRLRFTSDHPQLEDLVVDRELIVRRDLGREGVELSADPALLERMAAATGGRVGGLHQVPDVVADLLAPLKPRRRQQIETRSLWDGYLVLQVIVGLLLAEWIWRRRQGMP